MIGKIYNLFREGLKNGSLKDPMSPIQALKLKHCLYRFPPVRIQGYFRRDAYQFFVLTLLLDHSDSSDCWTLHQRNQARARFSRLRLLLTSSSVISSSAFTA